MGPPTSGDGKLPKDRSGNLINDGQGLGSWRKPSQSGFNYEKNEKLNLKRTGQGYLAKDSFKKNHPYPANRKKEKRKKSQKKIENLKSNEEYSHLVNSKKLTVFDWDCTIVLWNLPAQVDAVKRLAQREINEIAIKKFCPIKKTFKSNALVTLACVLNNKADVDKAVRKLSNLKVGDHRIIASRFVKPHSFISNAFSACILNFPDNASENLLSEILKDCGVVSSLDVQYSESGAVKKVLVNLTNTSDLASLLQKDGTQFESATLEVVPIKPCTSIIVGNVHPKISKDKLGKVFGKDVLLVQKMSNMIFQIFLKDEESTERALSKDEESLNDLIISVRPWSKKNSKHYKVFIHLTGNEKEGKGTFDINEFLLGCGKLCSTTLIKKNATFVVTFESKEGQKAALQLSGNIVHGKTVEVTKKPPVVKKFKPKSTDQSTASNVPMSHPSSKKNHVYFD